MITDKEGKIFGDRRKTDRRKSQRRKINEPVEVDKRKMNRRKTDRRTKSNVNKRSYLLIVGNFFVLKTYYKCN